MDWGSGVTYVGKTALREQTVRFGIKDVDRTSHCSILGRVGSGRGDLLVSMALQDSARGVGVLFVDATGTSSTKLLERLAPRDRERVVLLDPGDAEYPYSYNVLDDIRALPSHRAPEALAELLTRLYAVSPGPVIDEAVKLLLSREDTSLITFHSLVVDEEFRTKFFGDHAAEKKLFEAVCAGSPDLVAALETEGKYLAKDTLVRNVIGQATSKFTLGELDRGAIIVVDFSRIRMYPTRMAPLIRTLVHGLRLTAQDGGVPRALYLHDAIRHFSESELDVLFAPGHGVMVTVADTLIQEADHDRRLYALSRTASIVSFAAHPGDRALLERAFYPFIEADELVKLEPGEFAITLTIDHVRAKPFFAHALPLPDKQAVSYQDLVVASRERYTTPRSKVDAELRASSATDDPKKKKGPPGGGRGFQDAFRSIFEKQAQKAQGVLPTGPTTPPSGQAQPAAPSPSAAQPSARPPEKSEIPEAVLRDLLYVEPVLRVAV